MTDNARGTAAAATSEAAAAHCARQQPQPERWTACIEKAMNALMGTHGYSRERAASVVLRRLLRGRSIDSGVPDEKTTYAVMRAHGLRAGQAQRVLAISQAVEAHQVDLQCSALQAIESLTRQLSNASLIAEDEIDAGAEMATTTMMTRLASIDSRKTTATASVDSVAPPSPGSRHAKNDQGVSQSTMTNRSTTLSSMAKETPCLQPSASMLATPTPKTARKRTMDDSAAASSPETSPSRVRADSVTEAVSVKLQKNDGGPTPILTAAPLVTTTCTSARAMKRGRSDEVAADNNAAIPSTSKRSRHQS